AGLALRRALDVLRQFHAFAAVVFNLLVALAADALIDVVADLNGGVVAAQADIHQLDAVRSFRLVHQAGVTRAIRVVKVAITEQTPPQLPHALFDFARLDADDVLHLHVADLGAKEAAHPLAKNQPGPVGRTHRANELIDAFRGDAPANIGVNSQSLVDGLTLWVVGQHFGAWQVEEL